MTAPITTTIHNNTAYGRTVYWTAKAPIWLSGHGSTIIDYEPCSVASKKELISIITECERGDITLVLNVRQNDGTYKEIPYSPATATVSSTVKATPIEQPTRDIMVKQLDNDEKRHIISTKQENMDQVAKHIGVTSETVTPPAAVAVAAEKEDMMSVEGAAIEGFQKETPTEAANTVIADTEATEKQEAFEKRFAQLVEQKDWQGALEALMEYYGEDNIKFTARTVMQLKTLEKIKEKYNLD